MTEDVPAMELGEARHSLETFLMSARYQPEVQTYENFTSLFDTDTHPVSFALSSVALHIGMFNEHGDDRLVVRHEGWKYDLASTVNLERGRGNVQLGRSRRKFRFGVRTQDFVLFSGEKPQSAMEEIDGKIIQYPSLVHIKPGEAEETMSDILAKTSQVEDIDHKALGALLSSVSRAGHDAPEAMALFTAKSRLLIGGLLEATEHMN